MRQPHACPVPTSRRSTHSRVPAALFGIRSFSVRTSPAAVLNLSTGLLSLTYAAVASALAYAAVRACAGGAALAALRRTALAVLAALTATGVRRRARAVEPTDSGQVYGLYMTLWRDFYFAYLGLPFVR